MFLLTYTVKYNIKLPIRINFYKYIYVNFINYFLANYGHSLPQWTLLF